MLSRYTFLGSMGSFVRRAIEDELFSATSRVLMIGFEKKHHPVDTSLFLKLYFLQDVTPAELGVKDKFCLADPPEGQETHALPYSSAIVALKKIAMATTPTEKAGVLGLASSSFPSFSSGCFTLALFPPPAAQATREISICVKNYWETRGVEAIGDKYAMYGNLFFLHPELLANLLFFLSSFFFFFFFFFFAVVRTMSSQSLPT